MNLEAPLFASLPNEALDEIRRAARSCRFRPGEVMISEGDLASELYIIVDGRAEVVGRDGHGQPQTLAHLGPGDCFGELSMLSQEPASATVRSAGDTELWALSHVTFAAIAEQFPELAVNLSALLGERLRLANERCLNAQRAQTTLLFAPGDPSWGYPLALQLGRSLARHLRSPVALIDLSGAARERAAVGSRLATVEDAVREGARPPVPDAPAAGEDYLSVFVADRAEPSSNAAHVLGALEHLETHMRQILVYSTNESLARDSITPRADRALALVHESELAQGRLPVGDAATDGDGGLVLVSERRSAPSVGDLQSAGEAAGGRAPIFGIIAGGARALEDGAREDGHSRWAIDRLARRIAGLTVGLSLGGGGAKGYAHLGALRALERAGVPLDCITGCSIGGPVGVGVAAGWSLDEIRACLDGVGRKAIRPHLPLNSILSSSGIEGELRSRMGDLHFEDLTTPVGVTAVDIETGDEVLLQRGVVWPATLASMTIPGIYEPVRIDGRYLVDGGVRSPDPVKAAVSMGAGLVISSSLTVPQDGVGDAQAQQHRGPPFIVDAVIRSLEIMQNEIRTETSTRADVTILPAFTGPATILDFSRGPEFEEAGERAAEEALPRLRQALPWLP